MKLTRWLTWNSEHFTRHAGMLYFQYIIKPKFGLGPQDEAAIKEATGFWRQFAGVLNDHLRGRKYILGDTLTVADFAVGITLPYAETAQDTGRRISRSRALARTPERASGLARAVAGGKGGAA